MLVTIDDTTNRVLKIMHISPRHIEDRYEETATLRKVPTIILPEDTDLYELLPDNTLKLIDGWEDIKNEREAAKALEQAVIARKQLIESVASSVQALIDTEAQSEGFDSIDSITKYMLFDNTYKAAADSLALWVVAVWNKVDELKDAEEQPASIEEFISLLPTRS